MFTPLAKLFCVAALASAALAQTITITSPKANETFQGGENITVQLKESFTTNQVHEASLLLSTIAGIFDGHLLGKIIVDTKFAAQWQDNRDSFANYSVQVPDWVNGPVSIVATHFYATGAYSDMALECASVVINVGGNTG